jgi:hypothetical protein
VGDKSTIQSKTILVNSILAAVALYLPQVIEILGGESAKQFVESVGGPAGVYALQVTIVALTLLNVILRFATKQGVSAPALVKAVLDAVKKFRGLKTMLAIALLAGAISANAATFAFANFDAEEGRYETELHMINPTSASIPVPAFWDPYQIGFGLVTVKANSVHRTPQWPREGGGVASFEVPPGLIVYTQIRDPFGQIIRVPEVEPISNGEKAQFVDLCIDEEFASYVFVTSPEGSAVTVREFLDDVPTGVEHGILLSPGETAIPRLTAGNRATMEIGFRVGAPGLLAGDVYAFALISHKPKGEQFALLPIPTE